MRLDTAANIWALDLHALSGRDQGHVYVQRASLIIGEALRDPAKHDALFRGRQIRRKVLASLIGCSREALSKNPRIRKLIGEVEGKAIQSAGSTEAPSCEREIDLPPISRSVLDRLKQGAVVNGRHYDDRIVTTAHFFRTNGATREIPTLIFDGKIDEAGSDWLRQLVLREGAMPSTAKQYAKILRPFLRYCRKHCRDWFTVDDDFLIAWRASRSNKLDAHSINAELDVVFRFYAWAETEGLLSLHVGIYDREELPAGFRLKHFPISARRLKNGWASGVRVRASRSIEGRRKTPTDEQAIAVQEQLLKREQGERDALIAAWAEECGARRMEILQVRVDSLPSPDELRRLIDVEEDAKIHIRHRKRGSKAPLSVNIDLVMRTLDWIAGGRREIVQKHQATIGYKEPSKVFISSTTGHKLNEDSVTKIMRRAFKAAGVEKASLHRLRAKAIVEDIERVVDGFLEMEIAIDPSSNWADTVLVMVAETAGHASPQSLRPYLNFVLNRRLSNTEADRRKRLAEKTRDLERRAVRARVLLVHSGALEEVTRLLLEGNQTEALVRLNSLRQEYDRVAAFEPA